MTSTTRHDTTTHRTTRLPWRAAHVAIAGATTFLVLLAVLHVLTPELDPSWRMISEYQLGRFGVLMQVAFVAFAAACAAMVVALRHTATSRGSRAGLALLALAAVGAAVGGLAVTDPITATPDQLTTHGTVHGVGAMLGIPLFPLGATLVTRALSRRADHRAIRRVLWTLVALAWLSLAGMAAGMALTFAVHDGRFGPAVPIGWPNRLLMVSYSGWLVAAAVPLLARRPS